MSVHIGSPSILSFIARFSFLFSGGGGGGLPLRPAVVAGFWGVSGDRDG